MSYQGELVLLKLLLGDVLEALHHPRPHGLQRLLLRHPGGRDVQFIVVVVVRQELDFKGNRKSYQ